MRAFSYGEEFDQVQADGHIAPVFSESFLYDRMSKSDARFILGVVDEYRALIEFYGEKHIKAILETVSNKRKEVESE